MDRKILGQQIRARRQYLKLTQEQLAERMDVSTTYIGLVERGERSITLEKLMLLADCLQVSLSDLLELSSQTQAAQKERELQYLWQKATDGEKDLILSVAQTILNHSIQK